MNKYDEVDMIDRVLCITLGVLILLERAGKWLFGSMWTDAEKRVAERRRM